MNKQYEFVVVTPTFNRKLQLKRLYKSLCKQTYKNFYWLIVDDGSTDNTKQLIDALEIEKKVEIKYIYKQNGGKHTALIESFKHVQNATYYYIIDSDDELVESALMILKKTWDAIENAGVSDKVGIIKAQIKVHGAEKRAISILDNSDGFLDMTYHDFVFKYNNWGETSSSLRVRELGDFFLIPNDFKYKDKVKFFPEGVLWARAGRKTLTRYIPDVIRIMHHDADNSLQREKCKTGNEHLYVHIVSYIFFTQENIDYLWKYNKLKVIKDSTFYSTMCLLVGLKKEEILDNILNYRLRLLIIALYPFSIFIKFIYKLKNKNNIV